MKWIAVMLAIVLSGCVAELGDLKTTVIDEPTADHEGLEVIEGPEGEVIEHLPPLGDHEHEPMCLVRAKHFRGLVRISCDRIAEEVSP